MPTIELRDGFGLVVDASPDPECLFLKYLKNPRVITGVLHNANAIAGLQIGQVPFSSQTSGISFDKSIELGTSGAELVVKPELTSTVEIVKNDALFGGDEDPFRDPIPIPDKQHAFVSARIKAGVDAGVKDDASALKFGFIAGSEIALTNYRLFALTDDIAPAVRTLFEHFRVPGDLGDIEAMETGIVAAVEGSGSLKFSAEANLLSAVNPLATVNTAVNVGPLKLQDGGSLTVGAAYTLTGEYQLRVQRLDGKKFRLGYEKKRGSEFDVSAKAEFGAGPEVEGFDLIKGVLQAVSSDPVPDKDTFCKAGLKEEQISTIAEAIKTGIERSLELSLTSELNFLETTSTAFSYEIDLHAVDEAGREAVEHALRGDLSGLEGSALTGVKPLKSIFSTLRRGTRILKLNLLGIFNYASVSELFQKGTVIVDRQIGDITITDQVGANRVQFDSNNFAKNSGKLRKLLAESFLVTVTYRTSKTVLQAPGISSKYWFFELHEKANLANLQNYLQIAQALELIGLEQARNKLQQLRGSASLGLATLYLDSTYTNGVFHSLFLDGTGAARPKNEYERLGRQAMAALIVPDPPISDARLRPLQNDAIWQSMQGGTTTFSTVLRDQGFTPEEINAIIPDYLAIRWWADAMHNLADGLAQILGLFSQGTGPQVGDPKVMHLRKELDKRLSDVAANTHDHFGEPWGFLVMDLASGRKAPISLQMNCAKFALAASQTTTQQTTP
ncbi:MAG: hypothetical protein JOY62_18890 [Acidobacteriaceae bacterium]|nr:hypothetical protein [Acidobacteriaceae bacterium]MBV9782035.1 hypothetical protein [Acidobacteriaceae bacterium]